MYVYAPFACLMLMDIEESVRSLGTVVMEGYKPPCGCRNLNPGPLQDKPLLLTTESLGSGHPIQIIMLPHQTFSPTSNLDNFHLLFFNIDF